VPWFDYTYPIKTYETIAQVVKHMPQQSINHSMMIQFMKESQQPALLIDVDSFSILYNNSLCSELLEIPAASLTNSDFFKQLTHSTRKLLAQDLTFFNSEFVLGRRIILAIGEVRNKNLLVYLQEKYSFNMPSRHLIGILDNLGAYVYCKDSHYNYSYANQLVCDLFSRTREEIIGHPDSDFFDTETSEYIRNVSDSIVIEQGTDIEQEEVNFVSNENSYRTFLSVKKPLIGDNNKIVGLFGISTDISEYKAIEKKIRLSELKLNMVLDNVAAYIYIRDEKHCFTYINRMTENLFQRPFSEIKGKTPVDLLGDINGTEFERLDIDLYTTKEVVEGIEKFIADDDIFYYWTVKAPLFDDDGDVNGLIGMSIDITKQKKLEHQLELSNGLLKSKIDEITLLQSTLWEQATQDPLTQLFNRRYFNEVANKEIIKAKRNKQSMALLLLDVDYFKKINDKFGHSIGDKVLINFSQIMLDQCRRSDIVCRFGGEEFVILMPEVSREVAIQRAEKVRKCYQEEITKLLNYPATISIGIAMWHKDLDDLEGLTKAADQAMYQAKHNGRNQVVIYNSDSNNK
jgi:diguanylate cyclase (GGDEF)-like protein/PAS domain S-box-containing protein